MAMEIKQADLILVRGDDLIGKTIKFITHSPYSHLAGVVKPNELIEAQGFRRTGYQALDFYAGKVDVFTCDELTDEQRTQIVAGVTRYVGRRYSYMLLGWELLRYTFGVMLMPSKDWQPIICSTLWADAYHAAGVDLCPGIRFPTPADVANSKLLRMVGSI
jgi:hypothetical protein